MAETKTKKCKGGTIMDNNSNISLLQRIEIHKNEKKHSHNNVKVDIYFTAVGLVDIPTEQQLIEATEKLKCQNEIAEKTA